MAKKKYSLRRSGNFGKKATGEGFKTFTSPRFGAIRTAGTPEQPLFCLYDVAQAMGYSSTINLKRLQREDVIDIPVTVNDHRGNMHFLTIRGLRDACLNGHKAEQGSLLYQWMSHEVIPALTGKAQEDTVKSPESEDLGCVYSFAKMANELDFKSVPAMVGDLYGRKILYRKLSGGVTDGVFLVAPDLENMHLLTTQENRLTHKEVSVWTEAGRRFLLNVYKGIPAENNVAGSTEQVAKAPTPGEPKESELDFSGKATIAEVPSYPMPWDKEKGAHCIRELLDLLVRFQDITREVEELLEPVNATDEGGLPRLAELNFVYNRSRDTLVDVIQDITRLNCDP